MKLLLCLTEFNVVLGSIYFQHLTGELQPGLINYWKHVTVLRSRYRDNLSMRPHIHFATHVNIYD